MNALGQPAIEFQREPDRLYPQSTMAAHVLGYLDDKGHGRYGMEQVLDAQLSRPGAARPAGGLSLDAARAGGAGERAGQRDVAQLQARGAAGVILDVRPAK
jgi:cell division protein FtsI (penicillin-binding protein 3)